MTKREQVWRKYNGHCAYCGHEITLQEMQVDHIIPKRNGGSDDMNNLNPACRLCNQYKRANSLDIFRYWLLEGIIGRLLKLFIFRVAQRYGLITINKTRIDGFYFESIKQTKKNANK